MIVPTAQGISLKNYSTLRAGGEAEFFAICQTVDELADAAIQIQLQGGKATVIGSGSNILPSDAGVPGLVILNNARSIQFHEGGRVLASTGLLFQDLFLKAAQLGFSGLEYAVGIPGSIGGALVSNAGAYRSSINEFLVQVEIVLDGERRWVEPEFLEFSYRDSLMRRKPERQVLLLQIEMQLPVGNPHAIYEEARNYQRQRISKQPPPASCGSYFKNVVDKGLAAQLPGLREDLKNAGIIPSGVLIEEAGLKGLSHRGAQLSSRHANFILNVGGASATSIRSLSDFAKSCVQSKFGVLLEEEVVYLGDWSQYLPEAIQFP